MASASPHFQRFEGLVGREPEVELLQDAYKRVLDSPLSCKAILVHGESGTGKTILVQRSFQPQQDNGTLVSGKFDIIHSQKPYSAVVDALTQLCSDATWCNISNENALRAYAIKRLHASDLKILCKLVPAVEKRLSSLVATNDGDESDSDSSDVSNDTSFAFARFTKIVRSFVYVVARFLPSPLILFLDDVQAADAESLSLIASLTSRHSDSCNVLLILAYRDNEQNLNPDRVLSKNTAFDVTDIKINNFDAKNMNKLIAKMLRMDPEITIPFSTLVSQRTGGIVYHALQFMDVLRNERLLVYHFELCHWEWDLDKIRSTTNVTDNVAALLTSKIQQLSSGVQLAVQLAACLGFYFDIGFLERMVGQERVHTTGASKDCLADNQDDRTRETNSLSVDEGHGSIIFNQTIAIAVEENLINQVGGLKYKFTHDRVLQAAYEMNPAGRERDMLHWRIGRLLWTEHQKQYAELQGVTDEWLLFAAADQLNRGSNCGLTMADVVSTLDLARLNLDAGKAALEKSAFQHAAGFFDKGVKLIQDSWHEEYLLCLELHTFSAETNHAVSNFETCDQRISEILGNGRCLEDKLRAYLVKVKSLGVRGMVQKALDESSVVLKLLGSRISRRPNLLQMLWEITKTKRALKVQTIDFASLPDMTSPLTIWAVKFLHMYAIFAFFAGHLPGGVVSVRRMVDLTIKYGVSSQGPFVVATYGALLSVMGEFQAAYQAGRDAYELTKRPHSTGRAEATATVFAFLNHLREPLIRSFDHFMDGYNDGMKSGEIEGAAGCLSGYATLGTYLGKNLEIVKSEMEGFHQAYHNEIKNNFSMIILLPHHQFTLNMMGPCDNPLILTGEIMREEDYLEEVQKTGNNFAKSTYAIVRMVLLYIFCEFDLALTELPNLDLGNRGLHFATPFAHMFSALTLLAMTRKTRKPKYAWRAAGNIRYLRKMAKAGNLNVPPLLELVSAEQASLRRGSSPEDVKSAYESAVRVASRSGFSVVEAIGSERAGEYMQSIGDMFWAEIFFTRAYRLYDEWGAAMKTQQMMKKYNVFLAESENLSMSNRSISLSMGKRNSQRRSSERRRLSVME